jgi:GAF domain-containing protein
MRRSAALPAELESRLATLTTALAACRSMADALSTALDAAIALLRADLGNIQLYRAGMLTIAAQRGFTPAFLNHFRRVAADADCACGRAMREGRAIVITDVETDPGFAPFRAAAAAAGYRAVQSTPLVTTSGLFIGMLSTHFAAPHTPAADDMALLDRYAGLVADTIQKFAVETLIGPSPAEV